TEAEREASARRQLRRLVADQRLSFEVHTDAQPSGADTRSIDLSEVAQHKSDDAGYWMVIDGFVYDLTEFVQLHPGGRRVLQAYAGMDATHGYARAHHERAEVDAMRQMYRIGVVRALD